MVYFHIIGLLYNVYSFSRNRFPLGPDTDGLLKMRFILYSNWSEIEPGNMLGWKNNVGGTNFIGQKWV